jgi:hypothetical protein
MLCLIKKLMAVIGITINEVLRDFVGQLAYTYDKYIEPTNIKEGDVTSFDLINYFPFESVEELNRFLYGEASLEVFGHADQLHDNVMTLFNEFLMDIKDGEEHEIILISREVNKSISSTNFFLSKLGCRADHIRYVVNHEDKWDHCDILVTANPKAIESRPSGKISVKVNASYNSDIDADYEVDNIMEFISNDDLREKILNTKITKYEEIE